MISFSVDHFREFGGSVEVFRYELIERVAVICFEGMDGVGRYF